MTLDAVEWPAPDLGNPDDENANLIVVGQGAWDAPGIAMHFDNFRLIDTGNVPLQIRDLVITDTGMLSLSWDSSESQAYSIDESPTLLDWQEMIAGIEGAPGGLTSYTVLDPPITGANHYRVRISGRAAPLRENFENGQGDWTIGRKETNAGGTDWEVGAVTSGPGAAHSGTNAAGTNLGGDTDAGAHIYLRSPLVDLTTYTSPPTLSFWHALEGSGTFAARVTVLDSNGSILLETGEGDPGFFMEGTDGWEEFSMPLNVTGQKVFVEFELIMQDVGPGWYVDDVLVSE
jgi:hypothetical protein